MAAASPHPLSHLFHPHHAQQYVDVMRTGVDHLAEALARVNGPSTGRSPAAAAKPVFDVDLDRPLGAVDDVLGEISRLYLDDAIWFHEPTYAAHLNCPVVIPALLAELFVSGVNTSMDTFDQSVGATFIERRLIEWTSGRIGFGPDADGVFTSGGSQSNLQGLLLAREQALAAHPSRDVRDLRILASAEGHFSVQKAAGLLGLGEDAVIPIAVDSDHRLHPDALAKALADVSAYGLVPMAVVATAGTTDFGAIDPLRTIAELCMQYEIWMHVDAAYGGGLLVSPTRRDWLSGIEYADSVTVDYHKTWFQPVSSSALLVADGRTLRHATYNADYLNPKHAEQPNQVDKSLQTTRRFDALKLWTTLRATGPDLIGSYLDTVIDLTAEVSARMESLPAIEIAAAPQLSTIVFRYAPPGMSDELADRLNPRIRQALYDRGASMVAGTTLGGHRYLKFTLLNPMASADDILGIVDDIVALGEEISLGDRAVVA